MKNISALICVLFQVIGGNGFPANMEQPALSVSDFKQNNYMSINLNLVLLFTLRMTSNYFLTNENKRS